MRPSLFIPPPLTRSVVILPAPGHTLIFNARFDAPGDEFRFVGGLLSTSFMLRPQASIRRFADEYEQFAHQDARLPLEEPHGWSAILALRLCEYSEFSKLRRDEAAGKRTRKAKP